MFFSIGLFLVLLQPLKAQDFLDLHLRVQFDTIEEKVLGEVWHQVIIPEGLDTIMLNGIRMRYLEVKVNDLYVKVRSNDTAIFIPVQYTGEKIEIYLRYEAQPRKGIYFIGWQDETRRAKRQIWTQGQGIDHRHWIPHRDDQRDKIRFSADILFHPDYQVMSNGDLDLVAMDGELKSWHYSMEDEMSSYLIAIAIGKYEITKQHIDNCPHHLYHYPERIADSSWYYHRHRDIISFLNKEIGFSYPWGNYKQAPVMDFRHGAMENTCATIFGDFFLVDSIAFNDRNYTYVDAHEYAHQWFGNLVTAAGPQHHWLHEGFATYYQWLSEKEIYGDYQFEQKLDKARDLVFSASERDSLPLAHPKAGVERFYQKGGWLLHMLREYVGDSVYRAVIAEYLEKYAYKVVRNEDLIALFEKHSDRDIEAFFQAWLYGIGEPTLKIRRSPISQELIIDADRAVPQGIKLAFYKNGWWVHAPVEYPIAKGRNRIPLPDSVEFYEIGNASNLLVHLDLDLSPKYCVQLFTISADVWQRKRYLEQWPKGESTNAFLIDIMRDDSTEFALNRSHAAAALLKSGHAREGWPQLFEEVFESRWLPLEQQKELLELALQYKVALDPSILKDLREKGASYDLRSYALQASLMVLKPEECKWLADPMWAEQPGIIGKDLYQQTLIYRWAYFRDADALNTLIDFAGPSFDFNTRMNALRYLAFLPIDQVDYMPQLFDAFQNLNWKLSKSARVKLLEIKEKDPKRFKKGLKKAQRNWNDFQKQRAARIFGAE